MGASGCPGSEAQRDSSSFSLSPWSVPPLSVPRPCLSISSVSLSLGLWEAGPWLSTAPCFSREEDQQNFAVAQTYSLVRQAWPGPLGDTDSNVAATRKDKLLRFSPSLEGSRHRSRSGSDAAYIDPITTDYYNWGQFQKPREDDDDDDANSYENVLICKQKDPASDDEGSEDYQNSASIRQWRESRRVVEQVPREVPLSLAGSPDEDSEDPDYVNQNVAATEA
ncbi:linker for activation of T-cells family member 2 isoform X3 [Ursus americanus]|uniref:linker for activation of T-cells family member 2 isoform X3 n=1 Tax=Ursus americanus TaxID=9643 RepID=UPI001E67CCBE|nr:linker for activation of T-cells family member 2 isoform X3 [Ursus americanus]